MYFARSNGNFIINFSANSKLTKKNHFDEWMQFFVDFCDFDFYLRFHFWNFQAEEEGREAEATQAPSINTRSRGARGAVSGTPYNRRGRQVRGRPQPIVWHEGMTSSWLSSSAATKWIQNHSFRLTQSHGSRVPARSSTA